MILAAIGLAYLKRPMQMSGLSTKTEENSIFAPNQQSRFVFLFYTDTTK